MLDRRVGGDLLRLVLELRLGVLQELLLLARAAQHVHRALKRGHAPARELDGARDRLRHRVGTGHLHVGGLSTELLDPALDVARVRLRLAQVLFEALPVRRARGHRDVRLERGLELLLLAVRLVEVLDELQILGLYVSHAELPLPLGCRLQIRVPGVLTQTARPQARDQRVSCRSYGP